jgi:c-di-GMP-binding flagellar brake protein YcgR
MSDPATPANNKRSDNLLFRSHMEICRIMQTLGQEHSQVSAEIKNGHPFSSHVLAVDPGNNRFVIAYSAHKLINAMLLNSPSVEFTATDKQGLNYTFTVTAPEETQVGGENGIQFALPKALLLHNRREHPRIPVSGDLSLRCVADEAGFIPFESHITDISHDGLGCLIYDPDISLEKGTILKGCRIVTPNGDAVIADMELRYATPTRLPDGTLANRAGFQFVQRPDQIAKLVKLYIQDMDKK